MIDIGLNIRDIELSRSHYILLAFCALLFLIIGLAVTVPVFLTEEPEISEGPATILTLVASEVSPSQSVRTLQVGLVHSGS
jgi:hypothetical protein